MSERLSRPALFAALAIASGSVTGLVASIAGARFFTPKAAPTPTYVSVRESVPAPGVAIDPRVAGLEARLAMLEARPASSSAPAATTATPSAPPSSGDAQRAADRFRRAVDDHKKEPVDPSWARGASASFSKSLDALGKDAGFKVLDLDCRTTTCAGTLEFASVDSAQRGYRSVLHAPYDMNCRRRIAFEPDGDANAPPRATALFDCEEARATSAN